MEEITYAMHNTETVCWRSWAADYFALQRFAKLRKLIPQQFQGKNQKYNNDKQKTKTTKPNKQNLQNHLF